MSYGPRSVSYTVRPISTLARLGLLAKLRWASRLSILLWDNLCTRKKESLWLSKEMVSGILAGLILALRSHAAGLNQNALQHYQTRLQQ